MIHYPKFALADGVKIDLKQHPSIPVLYYHFAHDIVPYS